MRKFAVLGALLTLVLACGSFRLRVPAYATPPEEHLDLLLAGGQVVDGSGSPARLEDVGIGNDRIAFLGNEIGRAHSELQSPYDLVCRLLLEKKNGGGQNSRLRVADRRGRGIPRFVADARGRN